MTQKRRYDPEFKRNAVHLSETSGKSVTQIAEELGIAVKLLYRWRAESRRLQAEAFPGEGRRPALEAENAQLRRDMARLEQEREILKKPWPFSRRHCEPLSVHGCPPDGVSYPYLVRGVERVAEWLLCLAAAAFQSPF